MAALGFHHAGFGHREHGSDGSFHRILERFRVLRVLRVLGVRDYEKRKTGQGSLFERDCQVQNCLIFSLILFSLIIFVKRKVVRRLLSRYTGITKDNTSFALQHPACDGFMCFYSIPTTHHHHHHHHYCATK